MDETIGRKTLLELIKLQISILTEYQELLASDERRDAKRALNKIIKAAIDAAGPFLALQHLAYDKSVGLHEKAVDQTRELLKEFLEEEQGRADLHRDMRERAHERMRERAEEERMRERAERGEA
jgi:hypothetical protein